MWDTTHTTNKGEKCTGSDKYISVKWRQAQCRPGRSAQNVGRQTTRFGRGFLLQHYLLVGQYNSGCGRLRRCGDVEWWWCADRHCWRRHDRAEVEWERRERREHRGNLQTTSQHIGRDGTTKVWGQNSSNRVHSAVFPPLSRIGAKEG